VKIGIFGGTFNPIHFGHLRAAEEARELAGLDKVILIPSGTPPLKTKDIAPAHHRYAMTKLAVSKNPFFTAIDIECRRRKKSFTVETLEELLKLYHGDRLYFMLGIDAFLDLPNWYRPDILLSLTDFVIFPRPGSSFTELSTSPHLSVKREVLRKLDRGIIAAHVTTLTSGRAVTLMSVSAFDISATDIRTRIKQGKSIKYLLPAEVESYIISHNLYGFW